MHDLTRCDTGPDDHHDGIDVRLDRQNVSAGDGWQLNNNHIVELAACGKDFGDVWRACDAVWVVGILTCWDEVKALALLRLDRRNRVAFAIEDIDNTRRPSTTQAICQGAAGETEVDKTDLFEAVLGDAHREVKCNGGLPFTRNGGCDSHDDALLAIKEGAVHQLMGSRSAAVAG